MDRSERFRSIIKLLTVKKAVPKSEFLDKLSISEATFKRDIEYLRDRMDAPIIWDASVKGYKLDKNNGEDQNYELPGLWFNASEMQALLVMEFLLENLQPGLLASHLRPIRSQIKDLMGKGDHSSEEVAKRIKFLPIASRNYDLNKFGIVSSALLSRKKLQITYNNREKDEYTQRQISPQRLVLYRDNWYLDTWCHLRNGLRTFSLEAITEATILNSNSKDISENKLNLHLASSYGIYSGEPKEIAKLRFSPIRARWVFTEKWHPQQNSYFDKDGFYYLEIPFSDERELIMDVLKFGSDVEIISPPELRISIICKLQDSLKTYS